MRLGYVMVELLRLCVCINHEIFGERHLKHTRAMRKARHGPYIDAKVNRRGTPNGSDAGSR